MNRYYKILCVWVAVAMAFMGLFPMASLAQGVEVVEQMDERQPVPPRPDLMAQLQMAPPTRPGFSLHGVTDPKKANAAYRAYLSQKLGAMTTDQGRVAVQPQVRPTIDHVLVALVEFSDLAHNSIPKPNPQNNTDWWVEDFNRTHYMRLFFDAAWDYSLTNYFKEASCDFPVPYVLAGDVHPWTQVPGTARQYGNDAAIGVDNDVSDGYDIYTLVRHAADTVATWPAPPPARPLDGWFAYTGPDNIVDYFIVVHAGKGQEAGGGALGDDAIWSVRGTLPISYPIGVTGYFVKDFIVVPEDVTVGVLAHEMGHMFGLPDTWNPLSFDPTDEMDWPYQDAGPGARDASPAFYDTMGQGCWLGRPLGTKPATMTAWQRRQIGWLTRSNLAEWSLDQLPASAYLYQLSKPSAANKAITITLPNYAYTGTHVFWAYDPTYTNQPSHLTRTLQIPVTGSVQLRWKQRYELYANTARVNVRHAGGATTLATFTGTSPNWQKTGQVGWEQASVNLTPYLGQMIDVTFYLARTSVPEGEGWFLDDFELVHDGVVIWEDETEVSQYGPPPQWEGDEGWQSLNFPWIVAEHYYMAEWRNDGPTYSAAGFDMGLQEAYNMTDISTGKAKYFRYNPGLLLWYVNPRYQLGDNNIVRHPGAGFLLAVDSHPDPIMRASNPSLPWRSRVQMLDATFRHSASTYGAEVYELIGGTLYTTFIPSLPAVATFWDKMTSYPYWKPGAPDNSARTYQYGVRLDVEGENPDVSGATIKFSIDAGDMRTSKKSVSRSEAQPGDVLEYTIVLTNTGIADAHTIVVDDPRPANTEYIIGSAVVSGSPAYTLNETSAGLYWRGTVRLGQPVTITFRVQLVSVIDNGTVITNVARVREGNVPEVDLYAYTRVRSEPCLTSSRKESAPQAVYGGDLVTYTIYLENTGNSNTTVWVTDCIGTQPCPVTYDPGSLTFSSGQGYFDPQTNCIYWSGVVTAGIRGPAVVITFRGRVPEGQEICTRITNRAWINDGFHPPFDITAHTDVLRGSNFVNSTKTVSSAETAPGTVLTYTIRVRNSGNLDGGARLTDAIPANTTYVPGSLVITGGGSGAYDSINNRITWNGAVAKLATVTVRFNVTVTSPLTNGTIITNTALLVDDTRPNEPIYLITTTTVVSGPRLTHSTKSVRVVDPGTLLTYTIGLLNNGNENAMVIVTDTIPAGTAYIPGSFAVQPPGAGSGGYDAPNNRIVWSGPITAGARVTLTFGVNITLTGTGIITNSAVVNDGVNQPFTLTAISRVAGVGVVIPEGPIYCGDLITVPIRVCNVADLQGFEIKIGFDPAILNVESIQEGTWFYPAAWPTKIYSNTEGTATVAAMLLSRPSGLSDNGNCAVLFTLNFRAVSDGTSPVTITHSLLSNTPSPSFTPIAHNRINGSVTVNPRRIEGRAFLQGRPANDHDGAVLTSSASGSRVLATTAPDGRYSFCPPVGNGQSFTLYIKKNGYLYAQRTIVVSATPLVTLPDVTLLGGDPIAPQVTVVKPSYCVTVTTPLTITVAGNLDGSGDGKVNVLDLSFVGARFGKTPAAVDWVNTPDGCFPEYMSYRADINEDNVVNIFDLVLVGTNFYKQAPVPWP